MRKFGGNVGFGRLLGVVGTITGLIGTMVIGDIGNGKGWGVIVGLIGIIAIGDIGSGKSWGTIVGLIATVVIGDNGSRKSWGTFVPDMAHILPIHRYAATPTEGCSG